MSDCPAPAPSSEGDVGGEWVRPLSQFEDFLDVIQSKAGKMLTCYSITFNATRPLTEEDVREALRHLYRKIVTLRLTLHVRLGDGDEAGKRWFRDTQQENIDFQVIDESEYMETFMAMIRTPYDSQTGPLWKVRMIQGQKTKTEDFRTRNIPTGYDHEYKILFAFHHSITDGHSSLRICGHFKNLLNDVLCGRVIDDKVQLAVLANGEDHTNHIMEELMRKFQENPEEHEKALARYDSFKTEDVLILKAYPGAEKSKKVAVNLRYDFDFDTTRKFLSKCKSNGVSCHSGFFTATQLAMIDILKDGGIKQDEYKITSQHAINTRRYWPKGIDLDTQFGSNIACITMDYTFKKDSKKTIWEDAQKIHKKFVEDLNNFECQKNHICRGERMAPMIAAFFEANPEKIGNMPDIPPTFFYDTTNMGDITNILNGKFARKEKSSTEEPQKDDVVIVTDFTRSTSTMESVNVCSHVLQSLNGRLLYSLDYNIGNMPTEVAQKYVDAVVNVVKFAAEM